MRYDAWDMNKRAFDIWYTNMSGSIKVDIYCSSFHIWMVSQSFWFSPSSSYNSIKDDFKHLNFDCRPILMRSKFERLISNGLSINVSVRFAFNAIKWLRASHIYLALNWWHRTLPSFMVSHYTFEVNAKWWAQCVHVSFRSQYTHEIQLYWNCLGKSFDGTWKDHGV